MNPKLLNANTMDGICVTLGELVINFVALNTESIFLNLNLVYIINGKVGIANTCLLDLLDVTGLVVLNNNITF